MTTRFHLESWRKLYRTLPPSWLALPLSARGLGDELLKYADDDGVFALPPNEKEADAVCRVMCAHRDEWKRVAKDLDALVRDGYLVREAGGLCIRNFVVAQGRTPSAQRMARMRERERNEVPPLPRNSDANSDATVTVTVTSRSDGSDETRRDTTRRDGEAAPLAGPPLAVEVTPKVKVDRSTRCPCSVDPEAEAFCERWKIPSPSTNPEAANMLDHFASASGKDGLKTLWDATWRKWERKAAGWAKGGMNGTKTRTQLGLQQRITGEYDGGGFVDT